MLISEEILQAIEDAMYFLDEVADDRMNARIDYKRQDEVVKILQTFIDTQSVENNDETKTN